LKRAFKKSKSDRNCFEEVIFKFKAE